MADNVAITAGSGVTIAADELTDGVLGSVKVQYVKIMDGTLDGTSKATVGAAGLKVDGSGATQPVSGSVTALSGTAGNFLAQVSGTVTATGTVIVTSGTAANLLSQVSGSVTAVSGTAANLLTQVSQGTAGNLLATVNCGTAANMLATVSCGTASTLLAQVSQGTAANLLATVTCGTAANFLTTSTVSCGTAGNLLATVTCGTAANMLTTSTVSCGTAANLLSTATLAAGTANAGAVISYPGNLFFNGTANVTVSYAAVAFTASGDNTVVAGVTSKNIYVLAGLVVASAVTNVKWWSTSTAGTALTGLLTLAPNVGFQIPYCPFANFATPSTGQALVLNTSANGTVGGWIVYVAY